MFTNKKLKLVVILFLVGFVVSVGGSIVYYFTMTRDTGPDLSLGDMKKPKTQTEYSQPDTSRTEGPGEEIYEGKDEEDESQKTGEDPFREANEYFERWNKTSDNPEFDRILMDLVIHLNNHDLAAVSQLALEVVMNREDYSPLQYVTVSALTGFEEFNYYEQNDNWEEGFFLVSSINFLPFYVAGFYMLPPEMQAMFLPNESFMYVSTSRTQPVTILDIYEASVYEADAHLFFSDLSEAQIKAVDIRAGEGKYTVYVVDHPSLGFQITNIQSVFELDFIYTTYEDYFDIFGRREFHNWGL